MIALFHGSLEEEFEVIRTWLENVRGLFAKDDRIDLSTYQIKTSFVAEQLTLRSTVLNMRRSPQDGTRTGSAMEPNHEAMQALLELHYNDNTSLVVHDDMFFDTTDARTVEHHAIIRYAGHMRILIPDANDDLIIAQVPGSKLFMHPAPLQGSSGTTAAGCLLATTYQNGLGRDASQLFATSR